MTLDLEALKELAGRATGCERCHGDATLKATWSFGSNYLCDECFQEGQAETDEVEAFEMRNFFGAYGLPERPATERIARAALSPTPPADKEG